MLPPLLSPIWQVLTAAAREMGQLGDLNQGEQETPLPLLLAFSLTLTLAQAKPKQWLFFDATCIWLMSILHI